MQKACSSRFVSFASCASESIVVMFVIVSLAVAAVFVAIDGVDAERDKEEVEKHARTNSTGNSSWAHSR